jgi:hypothetical protein
MLMRRLTSGMVFYTTSDGNDEGTTLVARSLANQIDPNRYRGWWFMPTDGVSAGDIRQAGEGALNPSSGLLTFGVPFTSKIVSGTRVEGHMRLPPDEEVGPPIGLKQCLNLALAELWVPDRMTHAATGLLTMDLAEIGDWLDPQAIYELYSPALANVLPSPYGPFAVRGAAEKVQLDVIGVAAGTVLGVDVTRPGDTYMKIGGVWTDHQQGFTSDTDECLFQPAFLVEIALYHAYSALADITTGPAQARYAALAEDQLRRKNIAKLNLWRPSHESGGDAVQSSAWWGSKDFFA